MQKGVKEQKIRDELRRLRKENDRLKEEWDKMAARENDLVHQKCEAEERVKVLEDVVQRIYDSYGIANIEWLLGECPWLEAAPPKGEEEK